MDLTFRGKVWKFGDNISTDLMMPGFIVLRENLSPEQAKKYCMYSNRPGWAEQVKPGDIIVGRRNFGCGSSRPAAAVLKALGVSCVIAESMARLFFRNSVNLGFPVLIAPGVYDCCSEGDILHVDIRTGKIMNLITGKVIQTQPLAEDSPPMQILKAGGLIALLEKEYIT